MPNYSQRRIRRLLNQSDNAPNTYQKGRIFEDLGVYLFEKFSDVRLADRNIVDATGAQEIDLAFWNGKNSSLDIFDPIFLTECKNEAPALSSAKVREFVNKLRSRGANSGVLMSSSGIAGQFQNYRYANSVILDALTADRIKVIVIDRQDILTYNSTDDLLNDVQEKYLQLTLRRTMI